LNNRSLELYVSNVLRIGVVISSILIIIGLALYIVTGDASYPCGEASIHWIIYGDPFTAPSHILFLGFLILVSTPILRVAASTIAYIAEKDWIYTVITGFVLIVLMTGIILGLG